MPGSDPESLTATMTSVLDEISDQRIEPIWIFQPHEVATAILGGEHLQSGSGDLICVPPLRLRIKQAGFASDNQGRQGDAGQDIAPVLGIEVNQQARRKMARKVEIFADDPGDQIC